MTVDGAHRLAVDQIFDLDVAFGNRAQHAMDAALKSCLDGTYAQ